MQQNSRTLQGALLKLKGVGFRFSSTVFAIISIPIPRLT